MLEKIGWIQNFGENNMEKPLVSIVVPLFNYQNFIKDCVKSIINQDYDNYELFIVDDCSRDNSYRKAKQFENKRITVIKLDKNSGYSRAKNEGIVRSKGQFIITLDADDMMTKKSISRRVEAILNHNVEFVYANAFHVVGNIRLKECYNGRDFKIEKSKDLYNIHAQTVLIKREVYKRFGLYDEKLRSRSDREMWWRLFGKSNLDTPKVSSYYLDKCVAYYRCHPHSMWRKRKRNKKLDEKVIRQSEEAYELRRKEGTTRKNTRFLEI